MRSDLPDGYKEKIGSPKAAVWSDATQPICDVVNIITAQFAKGGIEVSWISDKLSDRIEKSTHKLLREVVIDTMRSNYPLLLTDERNIPHVQIYDEPLDMSVSVSLERFFYNFIHDFEPGEDRQFAADAIRKALDRAVEKAAI